jgi:hypothetical protein
MFFFTPFYTKNTTEKVKTFFRDFSLGTEVKNLKYLDSSFSVKNVNFFISNFPPQNSPVFQVKILVKNLKPGWLKMSLAFLFSSVPLSVSHSLGGCSRRIGVEQHMYVGGQRLYVPCDYLFQWL